MASYMITFIVIISSFILSGFAQLQLNPNPLRLTNGATSGSVQISCGIPSGVTASAVYAITVSRYLKPQPATEHRLARADSTVNQGQAALIANSGLSQNTATVSGSTSQKSMTLTLTQAKCEDAGTYVCKITYNAAAGDDTQIGNIDVNDNFTVIVPPGNITIIADPQIDPGAGNYLVGQLLSISCNGIIGTYDAAVGETWRWSWQYQNYEAYSWMPYLNENDITKEEPSPGASSCQYHQISKLTVNLTLEDSQRKYKCIVQANNNQGSSEAVYTLGIVAETELATPGTDVGRASTQASSTEGNAPTQTSSTGNYTYSEVAGIVAGVIVAMVVLNAISVVVAVFITKNKIKDSAYSKPMRTENQHIYLDINNTPTGHDGHVGGFGGVHNPRMPGHSEDTSSTYDNII